MVGRPARQNAIQTAGIGRLRIAARRLWTEPEAVLAEIAAFLGAIMIVRGNVASGLPTPLTITGELEVEEELQLAGDAVLLRGGSTPAGHRGEHLGCPLATAWPAQASIARSLGMSPNATTSAALTPCRAANRASPLAFDTPAAEISSSAVVEEWVLTRSPTTSTAAARNASGSSTSSRQA